MANSQAQARKTHEKIKQSAATLEVSAIEQTDSADRRTELAADRTILAAERTYAAWVRTASRHWPQALARGRCSTGWWRTG